MIYFLSFYRSTNDSTISTLSPIHDEEKTSFMMHNQETFFKKDFSGDLQTITLIKSTLMNISLLVRPPVLLDSHNIKQLSLQAHLVLLNM